MLRLDQVSKSFGKRKVLDRVGLRVPPGQILCITGPSGCGKTTLLEIMAGIVRPDSGRVERWEEPALAFQDDVLIPWLSARDNLAYILPGSQRELDTAHTAIHWLAAFGLEPASFPSAMSGGMRRRLNLARAFASGRRLLLLDEPFAFLDETWRSQVASKCEDHVRSGGSVVMSSHQIENLDGDSLRLVALHHGQVTDLR